MSTTRENERGGSDLLRNLQHGREGGIELGHHPCNVILGHVTGPVKTDRGRPGGDKNGSSGTDGGAGRDDEPGRPGLQAGEGRGGGRGDIGGSGHFRKAHSHFIKSYLSES